MTTTVKSSLCECQGESSKPDLVHCTFPCIAIHDLSDGCRQEQVFEREQVFGRDASSVFPTEGQKAAAEAAEALKSKLGANRFISESEVLLTELYILSAWRHTLKASS